MQLLSFQPYNSEQPCPSTSLGMLPFMFDATPDAALELAHVG